MTKVETAIEREIQNKGLTAKRITPDTLDAEIVSEQFHVFEGSCLTVCCLTLKNGFTVTGERALAMPSVAQSCPAYDVVSDERALLDAINK